MKKVFLIAALACVSVLLGTTLVLASGDRPARGEDRPRPGSGPTASGDAAPISGQASGGGCRLGVDTQLEELTLATDAETADVASGVRVTKPCQGVVVGQFVTEVQLGSSYGNPGVGSLYGYMLATCVGKGGFTNPCTVGSEVIASPGVMALDQDVEIGLQTRPMNAVWPSLKRGIWDFEMVVWNDGSQEILLEFSTFHVEAFAGGPAS